MSSVAIGDIDLYRIVSDPEGEIPSVVYSWKTKPVEPPLEVVLVDLDGAWPQDQTRFSTATATDGGSDTRRSLSLSKPFQVSIPRRASPSTGLTTSSTLSCTAWRLIQLNARDVVLCVECGNNNIKRVLHSSPSSVQPTDVVECMITATDAAGEQATSSATVMLGNTAPTLSVYPSHQYQFEHQQHAQMAVSGIRRVLHRPIHGKWKHRIGNGCDLRSRPQRL